MMTMLANPKAYLTEKQIVHRLRAIIDESDRKKRRDLIEDFKKTNGPDVCRGVLKRYGLHARGPEEFQHKLEEEI